MCKLVSLATVLERVACQIQQLLRARMKFLKAIAARVKTVIEKVKSMTDIGNVVDSATDFVADGIGNVADSIADSAGDFVGSIFKRH